MVGLTRDREFDCSECLQHVGQFAEHQLAGLPLNEALISVGHRLTLCPECREDYLALKKILRDDR